VSNQQTTEITRHFREARAETLRLFDLVREADLHESPGFGFRPIIWHLAHIGVFEAYWLLQKLKGEAAPDERFERIFDPINTPREASVNLPSRAEMESFLTLVRDRVMRHLDSSALDERDPLQRAGYVFQLVLEHEYQHQETLAYLLHLLHPSKKTRVELNAAQPLADETQALKPQTNEAQTIHAPAFDAQATAAPLMVTVPAGSFEMGAIWDTFAYDNERPAHIVELPAFRIDRLLTTNDEYARFINEGGYTRREFWSDEGWTWKEKESWTCPLYWSCNDDSNGSERSWRVQTMFDEGALAPQHPVTGVSWYEAEAYARFNGKRLPSEAEWEKAASWDAALQHKRRFAWGDEEPNATRCNFNSSFWGTTPVGIFPAGVSPYGCHDMTGNVWEWTSTPFAGYAGFGAFPYPEYSETWFDGDHRVLKGGSWATRASILRTSFRNFFRRRERIAFAGIRCASDV
jgi:ergothioneine biosynthesis protein EgtB